MRIGLIGFNTASGLGVVNRQIAKFMPLACWLYKKHRIFPTLDFPQGLDTTEDEDHFLESVDTLVFAENPLYLDLPARARAQGNRVVCVPMQEWFPGDTNKWSWPKSVDLFVCPTAHAYQELKNNWPCVCFPWPIDTSCFPFRKREECQRFLFLQGRGGWRNRKGSDVIRKAKQIWPEMPLVVHSQVDENNWPPGTEVRGAVTNPIDLYAEGDVLLAPHRADGIGLELLEAMSCGLPVVATDGMPWTELPLLAGIPATRGQQVIKRLVDWYDPDPSALALICKNLLNSDISTMSTKVAFFARERGWNMRKQAFNDFVTRCNI